MTQPPTQPIDPYVGLRCPSCTSAALHGGAGGSVRCARCSAMVRVEQGIAILAPRWHAVESQVEAARLVRPTWYLEEQPPEVSSPWRHHVRKRRLFVQRTIASYLRGQRIERTMRLLDLGCGDGNNLAWLSQFAEYSYGSDYNLVRLVRARAQNPKATIFAADILDFPSEDNLFDIVYFNHVIEHIPDDAAALATIARILKPGGLLVLGTPNEGAWWWQWAYRRDPESLINTDHVHFYTAATIGEKVSRAGLTLTDTHHMGWGPPDWKLDGRIRRYKLVDDVFTVIGRSLLPKQASSLYVMATKPPAA